MPYIIISPRVGVPGAEYDALGAEANGINVAALVEAGLLEISTTASDKHAKTNSKQSKKD